LTSEGVERVFYRGLEHPQGDVGPDPDGGGAMLSVGLAGGRARGTGFMDALTIRSGRPASLLHTMVVHPRSSSHRALDAAALARRGWRGALSV